MLLCPLTFPVFDEVSGFLHFPEGLMTAHREASLSSFLSAVAFSVYVKAMMTAVKVKKQPDLLNETL